MTDLSITDKNVENTIEVGRARWKIEMKDLIYKRMERLI